MMSTNSVNLDKLRISTLINECLFYGSLGELLKNIFFGC